MILNVVRTARIYDILVDFRSMGVKINMLDN